VKVEFSKGKKGYAEAENLLRIARELGTTPDTDRLRVELERRALEHLEDDELELARVREVMASEQPGPMARLAAAWHRFWGPSSGEMELSKQRGEALDRADRAERSSFEALAETAQVGRERDEALKNVELLRERLEQFENAEQK
jgi:hypothetical protein